MCKVGVLRNIWTARQYHQVLTGTAPLLTQYHKVPTSIAIKRPSTINYQLVPPMLTQCHQDHCCPILTQYTASLPRNAQLSQRLTESSSLYHDNITNIDAIHILILQQGRSDNNSVEVLLGGPGDINSEHADGSSSRDPFVNMAMISPLRFFCTGHSLQKL